MSDTVVTLGADLSQLRRELSKLPNMTDKQAQKMLVSLERTTQKAYKAAQAASSQLRRSQREQSRAAERASADARRGFKGLIEMAGLSGDRVDKVGDIMGALATPLGQVTLAATGASLAVGGLVAGIGAAVLASDDLARGLAPYREIEGFDGLPPGAIASIERANAAVGSLVPVAKQAVVVLGAEFAPVVEQTGRVLLKMGLMGLDALTQFANGKDALRELAVFLTDKLVQALATPISTTMNLVGVMGDLATAVGARGLGADLAHLNDRWDDVTRGISETAVDYYFDAAADAAGNLGDSLSDYDALADRIIGKTQELASQADRAAGSKRDQAAATRELAEAMAMEEEQLRSLEALQERSIDLRVQAANVVDTYTASSLTAMERLQQGERDALGELDTIYRERFQLAAQAGENLTQLEVELEARRTAIRAEAARQRQLLESKAAAEVAEQSRAASQAALGQAQMTVDGFSRIAGSLSDLASGSSSAAKAIWAVEKALAISQIVIATALAVARNAANPLAAGLAAGVGGAQLAVVAAENPKFHRGGMVQRAASAHAASTARLNPSEAGITAQVGEGLLNRQATRRLGRDGLREANRTGGRSLVERGSVSVQVYNHRALDAQMTDYVHLPSGVLRRALAKGTIRGHRNG